MTCSFGTGVSLGGVVWPDSVRLAGTTNPYRQGPISDQASGNSLPPALEALRRPPGARFLSSDLPSPSPDSSRSSPAGSPLPVQTGFPLPRPVRLARSHYASTSFSASTYLPSAVVSLAGSPAHKQHAAKKNRAGQSLPAHEASRAGDPFEDDKWQDSPAEERLKQMNHYLSRNWGL